MCGILARIALYGVLAIHLREFIGDRTGLVFATRTGKPLSQSNILKRQLHPLLNELGISVCGAHAFRRFRTTHLRKQRAPEGLVQFWLGHAVGVSPTAMTAFEKMLNIARKWHGQSVSDSRFRLLLYKLYKDLKNQWKRKSL